MWSAARTSSSRAPISILSARRRSRTARSRPNGAMSAATASCRTAGVVDLAPRDFRAAAARPRERLERRRILGQARKQHGEILKLCRDAVDDSGFLLQLSAHGDIARAHDDGTKALERLRPDDDVGDRGLVLDGHEDDAIGRARLLANGDETGDADARTRRLHA